MVGSDKSRGYRITMSSKGYTALSEVAAEQGRPMADVIREALENYLKEHGRDVSLGVDRGGFRGGRTESDTSVTTA